MSLCSCLLFVLGLLVSKHSTHLVRGRSYESITIFLIRLWKPLYLRINTSAPLFLFEPPCVLFFFSFVFFSSLSSFFLSFSFHFYLFFFFSVCLSCAGGICFLSETLSSHLQHILILKEALRQQVFEQRTCFLSLLTA